MTVQTSQIVAQGNGKGQDFFPKVNQEKENLTVDARELHGFLDSKQQFGNWIQNRIKQYDFQEGIDFVRFNNFIKSKEDGFFNPQNQTNQNDIGGDKRSIDYHLTIDMAKELCMVERNAKGREARRYFIECERRLKEKETGSGSFQPKLDPLRLSDNVERFAKMARRMGMQKNHIPQFINSMIVSSDGIDLFAIAGMKPGDAASAPANSATVSSSLTISAKERLGREIRSDLQDMSKIGRILPDIHYRKFSGKTAIHCYSVFHAWQAWQAENGKTIPAEIHSSSAFRRILRTYPGMVKEESTMIIMMKDRAKKCIVLDAEIDDGRPSQAQKALPQKTETVDPADAAATADWTDDDLMKNGAFTKAEIPMARRLLHHAIKWCAAKGIKQVPDPAEKAHLN